MPLRTVVSISLIYMTRMLGLFMVLPVLFLLGQDYPGATATTLGIALGIYGLTQASLQIPLGLLSDVVGRRPVLLAGLLIFLIGSVVAALADDVVWLIVGRALQGAGAISSTLLALLADLTPPKYRTRALAVVGISIGASFTLAMVVGPLAAQWWGLSGVFGLTAVMALACMGLVLTLPIPERSAQDGYQRWQASAVLPVLADRRLWSLNLGVFFLHAILASAFLFLPQQLQAAELSLGQQGLMYLVVGVLAFLALGPMMAISERRGKPRLMLLVAQGILALGLLTLGNSTGHLGWTLLAVLLFFVGFNFLEASLPSWLSRMAPTGQRGTAMGFFSTAQFLGAAMGGALGGRMLDVSGMSLVLMVALILLLIWFMLTLFQSAPPLSRQLVLQLNELGDRPAHVWQEHLAALDGVLDVHINEAEGSVMLRVSRNEFDEAALPAVQDNRKTE
ncbi:MFS transporter [Salinispirillum sp. LH 10-3-1]|uniref:MFS transporter n=1 Tax=Salinispirillum sp. LH 10-3-1 TaxID=2952525 RepID=A0AB38YJ41_9GAMM